MELILSIATVVLIGIILFLENERRTAVKGKEQSELRQYILEGEIDRINEEREALKSSLSAAHNRLNDLAHERDSLLEGLGGPPPKGNGK